METSPVSRRAKAVLRDGFSFCCFGINNCVVHISKSTFEPSLFGFRIDIFSPAVFTYIIENSARPAVCAFLPRTALAGVWRNYKLKVTVATLSVLAFRQKKRLFPAIRTDLSSHLHHPLYLTYMYYMRHIAEMSSQTKNPPRGGFLCRATVDWAARIRCLFTSDHIIPLFVKNAIIIFGSTFIPP